MKTEIGQQFFFVISPISNFMKIHQVVLEFHVPRQMDRLSDLKGTPQGSECTLKRCTVKPQTG
jgi:hypothetical protein